MGFGYCGIDRNTPSLPCYCPVGAIRAACLPICRGKYGRPPELLPAVRAIRSGRGYVLAAAASIRRAAAAVAAASIAPEPKDATQFGFLSFKSRF